LRSGTGKRGGKRGGLPADGNEETLRWNMQKKKVRMRSFVKRKKGSGQSEWNERGSI
jgi:hypothetical protein